MTEQDIINHLIKNLTFHRVTEFIEGHPKFLPHEVKDILYLVYKYGHDIGCNGMV